jgi:parvulin-like peptidyl-prolyl isomerase
MLPGVVGAKRGRKSTMGGRQRFALILFGAVFVLLFVGFAIAQGIGAPSVPSGDVAVVHDVPDEIADVSQKDFDHALAVQVAQAKLKKTPPSDSGKYEELKAGALGELLDQIWIEGQAEELGVQVTDKQVENELENIKKQNFPTPAAYTKFLQESHFTQEDVDDRVKLQLLSTQIQELVQASTPEASDAEIEAYYQAEKAKQFTTKETRDIRVIVNEDKSKVEAAKAALGKDNSPASWKNAAQKYSSDTTTKATGGLRKEVSEELVTGPVRSAIFDSATGELVGPVKFEKSYVVLEVVKLNPAKSQTLAEARKQINETLTQEKQQEFFSEFVTEYQTKWQQRTYCAPGYEVEGRCANFKGSGHPASASQACYEADPKEPAKECPAVVTPTSPALPGSVTEQKPKGEPFQQRPLPESSGEEGEAGAEVPAGGAPSGESSGE